MPNVSQLFALTGYDLVPVGTTAAVVVILVVWRKHERYSQDEDRRTALEADRNLQAVLGPMRPPKPQQALPPPQYIDTVAYERPARVRGELGR